MEYREFDRLNPSVQKWVYKQGWEDLREIQKEAIEPVLSERTDLVISASTASGKTEAAFLPAITAVTDVKDGFGILYISPLKALINDQYRRLEELCEMVDIEVTPWHGDSLQSKKRKVVRKPNGILLITPESLESQLVRNSGWIQSAFSNLKYVIIDEYHAFLGTERGTQLQSLMFRLENLMDGGFRPVPRIALSATLGDMEQVIKSLRPNGELPCKLISSTDGSPLKMLIKGYKIAEPIVDESSHHEPVEEDVTEEPELSTDQKIAEELFETLRGESNLIFANSRQRTEKFAAQLKDISERELVPNEFFPHHGSLSKELRAELEERLQKEKLPTTAVCTMTLELGIDIGKVNSVCQITAPFSVSGLRQRLGRSGRRGEPAVLRMYISETELNSTASMVDNLRLELLQSTAMINLLLKKWYEPADTELYHFSTMLHQVLAIIAQWGGVRADKLWNTLCSSGTFDNVTMEQFKELLTGMGEKDLISQLHSGELVLGMEGERIVDHYTFYAVFKTPEEFRVLVEGKSIGTIPVDSIIIPEQHIVFGGRRWLVENIDRPKKIIDVSPAKGGKPPKFAGDGLSVQNQVRQEMFRIYVNGEYGYNFMDEEAARLFAEGLKTFRDLQLKDRRVINNGNHVYVIPWMGDKIVNTIQIILVLKGYKVSSFAGVIEVPNAKPDDVTAALKEFLYDSGIKGTDLAQLVENREIEKYDRYLPENLLNINYAARVFDLPETRKWIKNNL